MAAVLGRYARAFAEVAVKQKLNPEKTVAELAQIATLMNDSRELRNVLANPAVSREQKLKLLDAIISRMEGSKVLRNFLAVLIDQRRIGNIGELVELFKQELDRRMGIADAKVEFSTGAERSGKEDAGNTAGSDYRQDRAGNVFRRRQPAGRRGSANRQHHL